jgi:predicted nucleic acid-binding protein
MDIWNATVPGYMSNVRYYIDKMQYYPEDSEYYQELKEKLDIAREKINKCRQEQNLRELEISNFVKDNKHIIENIKGTDKELYDMWVREYDLKL